MSSRSKNPRIPDELLELLVKARFSYVDGILGHTLTKGEKWIPLSNKARVEGYPVVSIDNRTYKTHKLVWLFHNGVVPNGLTVDHIDGNRCNFSISNLRLLTLHEQNHNLKCHREGKIPNVRLRKSGSKVVHEVVFEYHKQCFYAGGFFDLEEAKATALEFVQPAPQDMPQWEKLFVERYPHRDYRSACSAICARLGEDRHTLSMMNKRWILLGGRFYANILAPKEKRQLANCFGLEVEDNREDWARKLGSIASLTLHGGGVGLDVSKLRAAGSPCLSAEGQLAGGPCSFIRAADAMVEQLRSCRRGALLSQLRWDHPDMEEFMQLKDPSKKALSRTNISVQYDARWHDLVDEIIDAGFTFPTEEHAKAWAIFLRNIEMAVTAGEPGILFNGRKSPNEFGHIVNPCAEARGSKSGLSCNIGTLFLYNTMRETQTFEELISSSVVAAKALTQLLMKAVKNSVVKDREVHNVRKEENRLLIGFGGAFMLEAVLGRQKLATLLGAVTRAIRAHADYYADVIGVARPMAVTGCAPNGTTGIIAECCGGIEPPFAEAYSRRFASQNGFGRPKYRVSLDPGYARVMNDYGISMQTAQTITMEQRLEWQSFIQDFCDMGISSTINLPARGTAGNDLPVEDIARMLAKYHRRLAGVTFYPSGAIADQPLTPISYETATRLIANSGSEEITDTESLLELSTMSCKGGVCGQ